MFLLALLSSVFLYVSECKKVLDESSKTVTPVILIPGIFGSQVDGWYKKESVPHYYCTKDSKDWTTLWLCLECMLPPTLSCWMDTFSLNITDIDDICDREGVQTKVNDFGYTDGIGYLDKNHYVLQYELMVAGIEALPGYRRGISIRGAPYDYRHTPNTSKGKQYLVQLKYLIEETFELNSNNRVMIVAHSMGNPYMVNFLKHISQDWKDKYIAGYVAVAGVFGGSAKAIRALMSGETEDLPGIVINPLSMREFERSIPTIYWLMPPKHLWQDTPFVFANNRNYTAADLHTLLSDALVPSGMAMRGRVEDVPLFDPDLGVDVFCVHGVNQSTPLQFRYADGYFPDGWPTTVTGNGDGTVNIESLELCKQFKRLKGYKTVDGALATHLEILQREDVIAYVADLLTFTRRENYNSTDRGVLNF